METKQEYVIGCGLELLDDMQKDTATLIILDLPYFGVVDAEWDNMWKSLDDYLDWCKEWFLKSERALKSNGSLYYFNSQFKVMAATDILMESCTALKHRQFVIIDKGLQSVAGRTSDALRTYPNATEYFNFYTFQNGNHPLAWVRNYLKNEIIKSKGKITINDINTVFGTSTNGGQVASRVLNCKDSLMISEVFYNKLKIWLNEGVNDLYLKMNYTELCYTFNSMAGFADVWRFNFYKDKRYSHPTQKPFDLIERIVLTSSNVGDLVVDPAMGTGVSYKVCKSHNRNFIGRELNPKYEPDILSCAMPSTRSIESWVSA